MHILQLSNRKTLTLVENTFSVSDCEGWLVSGASCLLGILSVERVASETLPFH